MLQSHVTTTVESSENAEHILTASHRYWKLDHLDHCKYPAWLTFGVCTKYEEGYVSL